MNDTESRPDLDALRALSEAATPGPWIRRWASLDVHHMTGDDALTAQCDIDFAVAACSFVRDLLRQSPDHALHIDGLLAVGVDLARPTRETLAATPEPTLDAAWAEAEAALPYGARITRVWLRWDEMWVAEALEPQKRGWEGFGRTPAAALRALAARLHERTEG